MLFLGVLSAKAETPLRIDNDSFIGEGGGRSVCCVMDYSILSNCRLARLG